MSDKGQDLSNERIADYYTSLVHVESASLATVPLSQVYDGAGNITGIALSGFYGSMTEVPGTGDGPSDRVIINNYIYPEGYDDPTEWLDAFFPIGVIMLTTRNNNPGLRIAGTKWCKIDPPGQFLVGVGSSTDENGDVYEFGQHDQQPLGGDLAGEYRHRLTVDELPAHLHVTNDGMEVLPPMGGLPAMAGNNGEGTNRSFFYYFGAPVNEPGNTVDSIVGGAFLGQDEIQAFQNNTPYNGHSNYRDWLVVQRHDEGYRYTDADFSPTLGSYSLAGWGTSLVGGPGWAGFLDTTPLTPGWRPPGATEDTRFQFITYSYRPANIEWTLNGQLVRILQDHSGADDRNKDRVHPGTLTARQLIIARNYLIKLLGVEAAAEALDGVQRLIDMNATVREAGPLDHGWVNSQIPGTNYVQSQNAGGNRKHNNIPPNYGVYGWRRVELDHICGTTIPEIGPLWEATITTNKVSTAGAPFNLSTWALQHRPPLPGGGTGDPWDGRQPAEITIADGVYIYAEDDNDSKVPAMVIDDFPNDLTLINNGFIMGRGGNGGYEDVYGDGLGIDSLNGQDGGDAIEIIGSQGEIIINNSEGAIGGGGGGGAGSGISYGSGGGGGAGGGKGGRSRSWAEAIPGGAPGIRGVNGRASVGTVSRCSTQRAANAEQILNDGWGPVYDMFPGVGGAAGGSGGGSTYTAVNGNGGGRWLGPASRGGQNSNSTGGGGGRILSRDAWGGGTGGFPGTSRSVINVNADGSISIDPASSSQYGAYISGHVCSGRGRGEFGAKGIPWGNCGYRYTASSSVPYMRAYSRARGDECGGTTWVNGYFSPTGWNSEHNYLAYVSGGWADQPAANFGLGIPDPRGVGAGYWAGGGGGWSANGGDGSGGGAGGLGGWAIRIKRGSMMSYSFTGGGIVYGNKG